MNIRDLTNKIKSGPDSLEASLSECFPTIVGLGKENSYGFKLFNRYLCDEAFFLKCHRDILEWYEKDYKNSIFIDGKLNYKNKIVKRLVEKDLIIYIGNRSTDKGTKPLFLCTDNCENGVIRITGFETCMFDEIDAVRFKNAKCFGKKKNVSKIIFVDDILDHLKDIERHVMEKCSRK